MVRSTNRSLRALGDIFRDTQNNTVTPIPVPVSEDGRRGARCRKRRAVENLEELDDVVRVLGTTFEANKICMFEHLSTD